MGADHANGSSATPRRPGVGVGVIVTRGHEVLLVQRRHHGAGTWAAPGGYLDPGEGFVACAHRETEEETGVQIKNVMVRAVSNDRHPDGKHNVTIWLTAEHATGEATLAAPDELAAVAWFPWDALPEPIYLSTRNFLDGETFPTDAVATACMRVRTSHRRR